MRDRREFLKTLGIGSIFYGYSNFSSMVSATTALDQDDSVDIENITKDFYDSNLNRIRHNWINHGENISIDPLFHTTPFALRFVKESKAYLSMAHGEDKCFVSCL